MRRIKEVRDLFQKIAKATLSLNNEPANEGANIPLQVWGTQERCNLWGEWCYIKAEQAHRNGLLADRPANTPDYIQKADARVLRCAKRKIEIGLGLYCREMALTQAMLGV